MLVVAQKAAEGGGVGVPRPAEGVLERRVQEEGQEVHGAGEGCGLEGELRRT